MRCRRSCGPPAGSGPGGPDRRTTRWAPKARVCSSSAARKSTSRTYSGSRPAKRDRERRRSPQHPGIASAAGSGSRWRRRDPPAAYRRGSEMICAARRFPRPTWRKSCLSVQSGHVGTGADGSPAGGSGSGGSHSDDRRLRLNAYGQIMLEHARRSISEINAATERIAALRDPDSGTVRLAFLHSLASWLCSRSPAQISECSAAGPVHPQSGRGVRDGGVPGGRAR